MTRQPGRAIAPVPLREHRLTSTGDSELIRCPRAYAVFHEVPSAYAESVDGFLGALVKVIGEDSEDKTRAIREDFVFLRYSLGSFLAKQE